LALFSAGVLAPAPAVGKPIVVESPPVDGSAAGGTSRTSPVAEEACSFRHPICVHGGSSTLGVLDALEGAWDTGVVLGVPLPGSFDAWMTPGPSRSAIRSRDVLSHRDRVHAFSVIDSRLVASCSLDFVCARELYTASALEATPSIDDGTLRSEATALARLAVPCALIDTGVFQSHPDRALVDTHVAPHYIEGASIFFSWLDDAFAKEPGHFITASWAFVDTKTASDFDWATEPDVFDVVRESLKDALHPSSTLDDVLGELAVVRALSFEPAPPLAWDVAWPTVARTLASPEGVSETGAAYVRVDTKGHKPGAHLRVDASWEEHAKLRWAVVKLDAQGHELARYPATVAQKATEAHVQIVDVDDASALLVVVTNVGNWTHPFDPDDEVWEPHGWLLTIAAE
jgi:hypothetical protein